MELKPLAEKALSALKDLWQAMRDRSSYLVARISLTTDGRQQTADGEQLVASLGLDDSSKDNLNKFMDDTTWPEELFPLETCNSNLVTHSPDSPGAASDVTGYKLSPPQRDPATSTLIEVGQDANSGVTSYTLQVTRKNFYKHPIFWARFAGYGIPLAFLLYVLYLNYLPFGYHKTFTINVGSPNDTKVSEFYLEPSADLSDRKTAPDGTTYRELNGMATAVFKPNAVLKNANITVEVKGDGVSLIPPQIDFDPNSVKWDYSWDFTKGVPKGLTNNGNEAFPFEGGTYFNGKARVEMASSSDMFEEGPFTVYAEWMPTDDQNDFQEIVGHYNWELLQDKNQIRFRVGRMNNKDGPFYTIIYEIQDAETFFGTVHTALATYKSDSKNEFGYIELYVDGILAGHISINADMIWKDYNGEQNITLGRSGHGVSNSFKGSVDKVYLKNGLALEDKKELSIADLNLSTLDMQIDSVASISTITSLLLHAEQK